MSDHRGHEPCGTIWTFSQARSAETCSSLHFSNGPLGKRTVCWLTEMKVSVISLQENRSLIFPETTGLLRAL